MDFEKFTERAKSVMQAAQTLALRNDHQFLQTEHLLKVLLEDDSNVVKNLVRAAGGKPDQVLKDAEEALAKLPAVQGSGAGGLHISPALAKVIDQADILAKKSGDKYVTLERLLQAITLAPNTQAAKILAAQGVRAENLNKAVNDMRKGRTADSASSEDKFDALKKYARDLTAAARDGKLSVSVATRSPRGALIHFGVNVDTEGTPVRTASLPSPRTMVLWPTSTPFTSVIALSGPGVPSKITPRSRARGFCPTDCASTPVTKTVASAKNANRRMVSSTIG